MFAKLTFDDEFIDRRQLEKAKSTKLGSKAFGFLKVSPHNNMFEFFILHIRVDRHYLPLIFVCRNEYVTPIY